MCSERNDGLYRAITYLAAKTAFPLTLLSPSLFPVSHPSPMYSERNDGLYRVITYLVVQIIEELGPAHACLH